MKKEEGFKDQKNGRKIRSYNFSHTRAPITFRALGTISNETTRHIMAENGNQVKMVEMGFSRSTRHGYRGSQVDNGRQWSKMVGK